MANAHVIDNAVAESRTAANSIQFSQVLNAISDLKARHWRFVKSQGINSRACSPPRRLGPPVVPFYPFLVGRVPLLK